MGKFLYVFNQQDKNKLLNLGFVLLKSDEKQNIYVFANFIDEISKYFDLEGVERVCSDILTF